MKYIRHFFFFLVYIIKHHLGILALSFGYVLIWVIWNIITYINGLFIRHSAQTSLYNIVTNNLTITLLGTIAIILFLSDISDNTLAYIKIRPISLIGHTITKIISIWLILFLISTMLFISDSLLLGNFSWQYFFILCIVNLNIAIVSSSIASITNNWKVAIPLIIGYSGISTGLHPILMKGTIASWLKSLSLIAPAYKTLPVMGIIGMALLLVRELKRDIRA